MEFTEFRCIIPDVLFNLLEFCYSDNGLHCITINPAALVAATNVVILDVAR